MLSENIKHLLKSSDSQILFQMELEHGQTRPQTGRWNLFAPSSAWTYLVHVGKLGMDQRPPSVNCSKHMHLGVVKAFLCPRPSRRIITSSG